MVNYETIILEKKEHIAKITLNRPERMNAVDPQMSNELLSAFDEVSRDNEVNVLVLTGSGRAFCGGADVKDFVSGGIEGRDTATGTYRGPAGSTIIQKLRKMKIPTIAMVNGAAVGGGAALAFACDIRVGSEKARFMNAFIKRGLASGWGGPWLYPRVMGLAKALEIMLTGDFLEAKEAERVGALNRLVTSEELEKETMALARKFANGPGIAIRETKVQVYEGLFTDLETALQRSNQGEHVTIGTEDYREGVKAFFEKREPRFKGR